MKGTPGLTYQMSESCSLVFLNSLFLSGEGSGHVSADRAQNERVWCIEITESLTFFLQAVEADYPVDSLLRTVWLGGLKPFFAPDLRSK